jgi:hypothetical protein
MLGFAHHDGKIRALPLGTTLMVGVALMAGGLYFAVSQQDRYGSWSMDDNPLAGLLYFTGAVLILLRLYTRMDWLGRLPTLDAIVSLINSRAMTIYLWGNFAIFLAPFALEYAGLGQFDREDALGYTVEFAMAWALIFVAVLLVGWVEDLAAGKRARLLPFNRVKPVTVFEESAPAAPEAASPAPRVPDAPRPSLGNFVVDTHTGPSLNGSPNGHPRGGNVVLAERPVELADLDVEDDTPESVGAPAGRAADVRANFVVDEVSEEEAAELEDVQAGPAETRVADPANPTPIVVHVEEGAAVVLDPPAPDNREEGRPGSDAQ